MVSYVGKARATSEESEYMQRVKLLPCCVCLPEEQSSPTEVHHITEGSRRLGNLYCLPLCRKHHENVHLLRNQGAQQLWKQVNQTLGIRREWPTSKIIQKTG